MNKSTFFSVAFNRWFLLGLVVFVAVAVSRVPAEWGAWMMTRQSTLGLSGISGSLWKGQANMASFVYQGQTITLGKLNWDLQLASLLKLSPCAEVSISATTQSFRGEICSGVSGQFSLRNVDAYFPADLLKSRSPIPVMGKVSVHIEQMQLRGNVLLNMAGNLSWTEAQAANEVQWIPLGSFAAEFTDNKKNGIAAKIFTLDGPVDAQLDMELRAPNGGSVKGELKMPQSFINQYRLADFFAFIGPQSKQEGDKVVYQIQQEF